MRKTSKLLLLIILTIGSNCSRSDQNRNSKSEPKPSGQNVIHERWSQLDSIRHEIMGFDQLQTLEDSIIIIETVVYSAHQVFKINLSKSTFRLLVYYIHESCIPVLYPNMEKPDISCFDFDIERMGELSESNKLKIIDITNRIRFSNKETHKNVLDGISFEIRTNYLSEDLDVFLDNPTDSIFDELEKKLIEIVKE
jgi:hypothetical protein